MKYHFLDTGKSSLFTQMCHVENDSYHFYNKGSNIATFLYKISKKHPTTYRWIIATIRSVAPYFSDFFFVATNKDCYAYSGRTNLVKPFMAQPISPMEPFVS